MTGATKGEARISKSAPGDQDQSRGRWMALAAALLGWMFDGREMGLVPLVARPALMDLLKTKDVQAIGRWIAVATASFLVGAATGGVLFGWLGDRIGRVRAMTLSVLTYSLCSGLSAASSSLWQLAGLRFVGALGTYVTGLLLVVAVTVSGRAVMTPAPLFANV